DRGGTRVDECRVGGGPRRQQIPGGAAGIDRHPRQRDDVPPVLAPGERRAEVVRRAARRDRVRQRGQAARQFARALIGARIENALTRGCGRCGVSRDAAGAQIAPPEVTLGASRLRMHRLLQTTSVEPRGARSRVTSKSTPASRRSRASPLPANLNTSVSPWVVWARISCAVVVALV